MALKVCVCFDKLLTGLENYLEKYLEKLFCENSPPTTSVFGMSGTFDIFNGCQLGEKTNLFPESSSTLPQGLCLSPLHS